MRPGHVAFGPQLVGEWCGGAAQRFKVQCNRKSASAPQASATPLSRPPSSSSPPFLSSLSFCLWLAVRSHLARSEWLPASRARVRWRTSLATVTGQTARATATSTAQLTADCQLQLQLRRAMTSPSRHVWKLHTIIKRLYSCRDISRTHPLQLPGRQIPCSRVRKYTERKLSLFVKYTYMYHIQYMYTLNYHCLQVLFI